MIDSRPIEVAAWDTSEDVVLSLEEITEIETSGLAEVIHGTSDGHFRVKSSSKIGLVIGDDWELRVMPHLAIPRLMFLLGYAKDEKGWRDTVASFEEHDDLFTAMANAFSHHATWALDRGVLRGYIHRDERLINLRGRIRFGDHIARSGGLPLPVEVSYDDFTEDVLENQMLRSAASLLVRLPRVPQATRRRLLRMRALLADVEELPAGSSPKAPPITRLNSRYEAALVLAELVLSAASTGSSRDTTRATTFVFDMNKVFEDFVTVALGEALERHGGELRSQVTQMKLSQHIPIKPDLAWYREGQWEAVLDVKYKPLYSESFPNGDAYQMLAYTLAYGLGEGWLIYARAPGELESRTHVIASAGKRIIVSALDVTREPDELLANVRSLASTIAHSRGVRAHRRMKPLPEQWRGCVTSLSFAMEGRTASGGAHTSRTMMLSELRQLLASCPPEATRQDYEQAVRDDNVLGKTSGSSRQRSFRYLRELYGLDPSVPSFHALRRLWNLDAEAQPLIALSSALTRDPALLGTATAVLRAPHGATVTAEDLAASVTETYPGSYSDAVANKIGRNAASTWTQSGHLVGRTNKIRTDANPRSASVAYALYLASIEGLEGDPLFGSLVVVAQDAPTYALKELARSASRRGWLDFRSIGNVTEIGFNDLAATDGGLA